MRQFGRCVLSHGRRQVQEKASLYIVFFVATLKIAVSNWRRCPFMHGNWLKRGGGGGTRTYLHGALPRAEKVTKGRTVNGYQSRDPPFRTQRQIVSIPCESHLLPFNRNVFFHGLLQASLRNDGTTRRHLRQNLAGKIEYKRAMYIRKHTWTKLCTSSQNNYIVLNSGSHLSISSLHFPRPQ